jgi:hypothetical protein
MDELDLIRSFRASAAPPSALATARAERAWRRREPRGPRRSMRFAAVAAALAAAVIAVALVVPSDRAGRVGTPDARAAETLRRAAEAHEEGGLARPLRPGEFFYVRTRTAWGMGGDTAGGWTVIQPGIRESWVAADGARRWRTRPYGELRFPGERDRRRWEAAGSPSAGGSSEHRVGPPRKGPFYVGAAPATYEELLALPRDAESLYERLRQAAVDCDCGHSVDNETFVIVGDLMRENPVPADLMASLLRATALIPGIKLIERERDQAGRVGVGVAVDYAGHRDVLVFDPDTYRWMGENERLLERKDYVDGDPGELIGGAAIMESGVVDSIDAVP